MGDDVRDDRASDRDANLIAAVWRRDLSAVHQALRAGADARARDAESGLTALMIAAGSGMVQLVQLLLEAGADIFATDSKAGATPLHKACQAGSLETVQLLLEHGAYIDAAVASTGHTPLIEALWFTHPDIVACLLDNGARLEHQTSYGFTLAQHYEFAVKVNLAAQAQLQEIGKAIDRRRAADQQAVAAQQLIAATAAGDLAAVQRLLQAGVPVDPRAPMLNGFNDAHTPLLIAARDGHTAIVNELLQAGANPNATEPTFLAVPLHKAVYNGHAEITALLARHPDIQLDVQGGTNGYTPLHDALWHGYADCADILVRAGASLHLRGHDGKTPHDIAAEALGPSHPLTVKIEAASGPA